MASKFEETGALHSVWNTPGADFEASGGDHWRRQKGKSFDAPFPFKLWNQQLFGWQMWTHEPKHFSLLCSKTPVRRFPLWGISANSLCGSRIWYQWKLKNTLTLKNTEMSLVSETLCLSWKASARYVSFRLDLKTPELNPEYIGLYDLLGKQKPRLRCFKRCKSTSLRRNIWNLLLMAEILHHLGYIKPYKQWNIYHINWCRTSSINSMKKPIGIEYFQ